VSAVPHRDKVTGQATAAPHGVVMGPNVEHVTGDDMVAMATAFRRPYITEGRQRPAPYLYSRPVSPEEWKP
jgi:hypothetical protein